MPDQNYLHLEANHDEGARDAFVLSLKLHINLGMAPGLKTVYEKRAVPAFEKVHGRPPKDRHEVRRQMLEEDYFQMWGSLWRTAQHLMWESSETKVDRQLPELNKRAKVKGRKLGSLRLDPKLEMPRYLTAVHIHGQPGGYGLDQSDDDVSAGAFYEQGMLLYGRGQGHPASGNPAQNIADFVKTTYPGLKPRKILDEGSSIGGCLPVMAKEFPGAELHAIEVSAGMVRYGHRRMEDMGLAVHFSQQNAEHTDFPDESFDLVVSNIMLHETSAAALRNIMKDCHRILRPGGVAVHLDVPLRNKDLDLYTEWYRDWSTHFNNEPFWGKLHDMDVIKPLVEAGFAREKTFDTYLKNRSGDGVWWACGAQK
ncbi:MAG: class I SAM-dependent methyltransferase [Proteobacteria bacterium]|nr:class I SAM-dependent methyltransferase [Pseudomonadota bacterium]